MNVQQNSKGSLGEVGRHHRSVEGDVRRLRGHVRTKYGAETPTDHPTFGWAVRHDNFRCGLDHRGKEDGKTLGRNSDVERSQRIELQVGASSWVEGSEFGLFEKARWTSI